MGCFIPVLSVAGSDPSGGAGVQADIKTLSALGCYAATAITALTVQNTQGVFDCLTVEPPLVEAQIRAVMDDLRPRVVKIGMLGNAPIVEAVARVLGEYANLKIILDPVACSSSGRVLIDNQGLEMMRRRLFPMVDLLTPNLPEARLLTGMSMAQEGDFSIAAETLLKLGCRHVLLKGGHLEGEEKTDRLYFRTDGQLRELLFSSKSLSSANTHGTGCTLSSAIAAFVARGFDMAQAVERAKRYVTEAIAAAADVEIGHGCGPLNHFFAPQPLVKTLRK